MSRTRAVLLHVLFFFSGVAALGYQLIWSKVLSTGLGHEMPAVLAIVSAFMLGMALGASIVDRFIPRSRDAGYWLAGLELTIGAWSALTPFILPRTNDWALHWIGVAPSPVRHWFVAFSLPALVLLPATAGMGATLPAMEKFLSAVAPEKSSIGSVYAANTLGAVLGALLPPFILMPWLGLSNACWLLSGLNGAIAIFLGCITRRLKTEDRVPLPSGQPVQDISFARCALTLFATGLLGIGYETTGVRVLASVLQNTIYTYASVLAVFLAGTAAGAAAYHRWWRGAERRKMLFALLWLTAIGCFCGVIALANAKRIYEWIRPEDETLWRAAVSELFVAITVFALPTFGMGGLFSHLSQIAREQRGRIGSVLALNTAGAACAPVLCGVLLVPLIGTKWTLCLVATAYASLAIGLPRLKVMVIGLLPALIATLSSVRVVDVPPGGILRAYREGIMASVAVVEDSKGGRTLRVDNRFQMGGTTATDAEYRQAHLPLLLHPSPNRALFLGVGTGISMGAATLYPNLKADGVELVPEVVPMLHYFEPQNFAPLRHPQLNIHVADARRFVRATEQAADYDVIVADLFHPYRDGAGALYTREHFGAIRRRLRPDSPSLFCQWLPLHQLDEETLRVVVRTFLSEFPDAEAWLLRFNVDVPVVGLIGGRGVRPWLTNAVERHANDAQLAPELKRLALGDSLRLYGHLLADSTALNTFAGAAPLSTDDDQRITFMAPKAAYQRHAKPYASLLALLEVSQTWQLGVAHLPQSFAEQLQRYLTARNSYLHGLIHDAEGREDQAIDAYVESARLSVDFTSGYAQCLSIAQALARSEPARAKRILEQLVEAQPDRPVAKQLLERLF